MTQIVRRSTKHTNDVMAILKSKHHATNAEIAQELRNIHPEVSDTTVHRITQRLCGDGIIGLAPPTKKVACDMIFVRTITIILCVVTAMV